MSELDQVAVGRLIEAVDTLKTVCANLESKVDTLSGKITSIESGWKAIAGVSAVVGGFISVGLIKIAPFIGITPK